MSGQSPPAPTRGPNVGGDEEEGEEGEEGGGGGGGASEPVSLADLMPKVTMMSLFIQWNSSNTDTSGTEESVHIREVSSFQGCP